VQVRGSGSSTSVESKEDYDHSFELKLRTSAVLCGLKINQQSIELKL
jgi:hypothetical protein